MPTALRHRELVGVNNRNETGVRMGNVPLATGLKFAWERLQHPVDVAAVNQTARILREKLGRFRRKIAFLQIRAYKLFLRVVLAKQDCLRHAITHRPTPARQVPRR